MGLFCAGIEEGNKVARFLFYCLEAVDIECHFGACGDLSKFISNVLEMPASMEVCP